MIAQTVIICLLVKILMGISWFSILLFLIFVGGLIILFTYIASLTPNRYNILSPSQVYIYSFLTYFLLVLLFLCYIYRYTTPFSSLTLTFPISTAQNFTFKIYSTSFIRIILRLFVYLLLRLFIVVFIILINQGPLRNINKPSS